MNKKEIISYLSKELHFTKVDVEAMLEQQNVVLALMVKIMQEKGIEKLRLGDLILEMKKTEARDYINPRTKKLMKLDEKTSIKVKYKKRKRYGEDKDGED